MLARGATTEVRSDHKDARVCLFRPVEHEVATRRASGVDAHVLERATVEAAAVDVFQELFGHDHVQELPRCRAPAGPGATLTFRYGSDVPLCAQDSHSRAAARIPKADTYFVVTMAGMRLWSPLGRARRYPRGRCRRGQLRYGVVADLQLTRWARFEARQTRLRREEAIATKRRAHGRHCRPTAGRSPADDVTGRPRRGPRCGRGVSPR